MTAETCPNTGWDQALCLCGPCKARKLQEQLPQPEEQPEEFSGPAVVVEAHKNVRSAARARGRDPRTPAERAAQAELATERAAQCLEMAEDFAGRLWLGRVAGPAQVRRLHACADTYRKLAERDGER